MNPYSKQLVRIIKFHGMTTKIYKTTTNGFPYEFKIKINKAWSRESRILKNCGWKNDPTSHSSVKVALESAKETAAWYSSHTPMDFKSTRQIVIDLISRKHPNEHVRFF